MKSMEHIVLPTDTKEIFETLRLGAFLTANDPERSRRKLYRVCDENAEVLAAYFKPLGYDLNRGKGYFFFSKEFQRTQFEKKVAKILEMIDLIALMMDYDSDFGVGWRGRPGALAESAEDNIVLKERIGRLSGIKGDTVPAKCKSVFEKMRDNGYMGIENEESETYLVLDSYDYIRTFIESIREEQTNDATA